MNTAADPSPLQLLRDALPTLSGARLRVAEVVLTDPLEAGRNSITWLAGKADTQPLFPDDPSLAANRRVTITLMREEPPLPPNLKP